MEDFKKKNAADMNDKEIVFSQSIKAGKRIYYLDVKKNRKDEMFLAITESKKIVMASSRNSKAAIQDIPLTKRLKVPKREKKNCRKRKKRLHWKEKSR